MRRESRNVDNEIKDNEVVKIKTIFMSQLGCGAHCEF